MRIWFKMVADARLLQTDTVEDYRDDTRTHKIIHALEEVCRKWDLAVPAWLDTNQKEFMRSSRTRFTKDSFVEAIEFDYLEIEVLEEDY